MSDNSWTLSRILFASYRKLKLELKRSVFSYQVATIMIIIRVRVWNSEYGLCLPGTEHLISLSISSTGCCAQKCGAHYPDK